MLCRTEARQLCDFPSLLPVLNSTRGPRQFGPFDSNVSSPSKLRDFAHVLSLPFRLLVFGWGGQNAVPPY